VLLSWLARCTLTFEGAGIRVKDYASFIDDEEEEEEEEENKEEEEDDDDEGEPNGAAEGLTPKTIWRKVRFGRAGSVRGGICSCDADGMRGDAGEGAGGRGSCLIKASTAGKEPGFGP